MILVQPQMRLFQADLLDFRPRNDSLAMQTSIVYLFVSIVLVCCLDFRVRKSWEWEVLNGDILIEFAEACKLHAYPLRKV